MRKLEIRAFLGLILTVLLVFAPFPGGFAFADNTTTLTATADATINQGSATTNYGTTPAINAAVPLSTAVQRALVKFTLTSVPAAIKAAYLKMTLTSTGAPAPSASTQAVHTVTGATLWIEGNVTWNNRIAGTAWTSAGGDYVPQVISTQSSGTTNGATITWPVYWDGSNTNIVQLWKSGGLANNGLLIKDNTESGNPNPNPPTATQALSEAAASALWPTGYTTSATLPTSYGLYLAFIALGDAGTAPGAITGVTGGGLTFAYKAAIASGNLATTSLSRSELWWVIGTPTAGQVTVTFPSQTVSVTIIITSFTGFDPNDPLGTSGTATGNTSSATKALTTTAPNSLAYAGVWARDQSVSNWSLSSPAFTPITTAGSTGNTNVAAVACSTSPVAAPGSVTATATLSTTARWGIIAVEVKQQVAPQYNSRTGTGTLPQLEVHYIADTPSRSRTASVSAVNLVWAMPTGGTYTGTSGTLIVKREGASATTFTPADANNSYTAGTTTGDGISLLYRTDWTTGFVDENGADSVLAPSAPYTYKIWVRDDTTISGFGTAPYYSVGTAYTSVTTPAAGTGATKNWSYLTGAATLAPPSLNPSTGVIAGSNDSKVHSMSASTGVRKYQPAGSTGITGGAIQSRPAVIPQGVTSLTSCSCDVVYVGANDGKVYAFNAATGVNLWTSLRLTNEGGFIQGGPAVQLKAYSNGSYTRSTDLVVVGTRNLSDTTTNKIYGLDGNSGEVVWTFAPVLANLDIINSTPWINYADNTLWVTSRSNSNTQPSIWKLYTVNSGPFTTPVASITPSAPTNKDIDTSPTLNETAGGAATFLYAVTLGNDLVAVDLSNYAAYTTNVSTGATGGAGFPIPIVDGTTAGSDDLYFTCSGGSGGVYKYTFNRSTHAFTSKWSRTTLAGASTPIFDPGTTLAIYVGAGDGKIHKLNTTSGADVGTARTANALATTGDPSFDTVANKIYIGATDGRIYSFDKW